jgi:hypothetical protein
LARPGVSYYGAGERASATWDADEDDADDEQDMDEGYHEDDVEKEDDEPKW